MHGRGPAGGRAGRVGAPARHRRRGHARRASGPDALPGQIDGQERGSALLVSSEPTRRRNNGIASHGPCNDETSLVVQNTRAVSCSSTSKPVPTGPPPTGAGVPCTRAAVTTTANRATSAIRRRARGQVRGQGRGCPRGGHRRVPRYRRGGSPAGPHPAGFTVSCPEQPPVSHALLALAPSGDALCVGADRHRFRAGGVAWQPSPGGWHAASGAGQPGRVPCTSDAIGRRRRRSRSSRSS